MKSRPASPKTVFLSRWPVPLILLALMTLGVFAGVLFTSERIVLSHAGTDLAQQFLHWRSFGFEELRRGNLALWNPHLFSGAPFFGGFQSALLYPPNALFLFLPVERAVNWSIALHVFLAGAFTYAWAVRRGLNPAASFLAATLFMFCGAHFLHIYAGHLPNLCAMIWAPLLFLAIDGLFDQPSLGWSLLGAFAVAMQILAGHPQYVFYTGVAAAVYCALCWLKAHERMGFTAGLAAIVLGGAALSAVQLFTSLSESGEMLRRGSVPYEFAASFSLPPENLLTALAPDLFGGLQATPYWGRWYLWEMSLFIGAGGLALAVVGMVQGERATRRFSAVMLVVLLLLALGSHTPLFKLLYHGVPGFNLFRGSSKFVFLASLFLALLAGIGFDALWKGSKPGWLLLGVIASAGLLLAGAAWWLHNLAPDPGDVWRSILVAVRNRPEESALPLASYDDPAFLRQTAAAAAQSLLVAGLSVVIIALLLGASRKYRFALWPLLALAVTELLLFAGRSLDHFSPDPPAPAEVTDLVKLNYGDYRVLNPDATTVNAALSLRARDLWGHDPGVLRRYAEFIGVTQGIPPGEVTQDIPFANDHALFSLLRCRFIFTTEDDGRMKVHPRTDFLPQLLLVQHYRVLKSRDAILPALAGPAFNPRHEVILESEPDPEPWPAANSGTVTLVDASTDHLTIEANLPSPSLLIITDTYAKGWRARALPGSAQANYTVLPANYCLRAIPLATGKHHLRLEYLPSGFVLGKWVSIIAAAGFVMLLLGVVFRNRFRRSPRG